MKSKNIAILFIYIITFLSYAYCQKKITIKDGDNTRQIYSINSLTFIDYKINNLYVIDTIINQTKYNVIKINNFSLYNSFSKPAIPCKTEIIGFTSNNPQIIIEDTSFIEINNINLLPISNEEKIIDFIKIIKDSSIYNKNDFYPREIVKIEHSQSFKKIPLTFVSTFPIQFNPVEKKIRIYTKIKYSIKTNYKKNEAIIQNLSNKNLTFLSNLIDNNDELKTIKNNNVNYKYIILCHNDLKEIVDTFANWKIQLGFDVKIISKNEWTPSLIKSTILKENELFNNQLDYVLLIGDNDGTYAMPSNMINTTQNHISDNPFACLNDNDYIPDVSIGRIPIKTKDELSNVINKIIKFEKNPINDTNFYNNIIHSSFFQDDNTNSYEDRRFVLTSEEIIKYYRSINKYNIKRIYYCNPNIYPIYYNNDYFSNGAKLPVEIQKPNYSWTQNKSDIIKSINDGCVYVLHRGHGRYMGLGWQDPSFVINDIDSLNNLNKYPIIFSINCYSGQFEISECFAEKILRKKNAGASGIIAASYASESGYNDYLTLGIFRTMYPDLPIVNNGLMAGDTILNMPQKEPIYSIRDLLSNGLIIMNKMWEGTNELHKYQYEIFHCFGDPSMKIWTENPYKNYILPIHNNLINCNDTILEINNINVDSSLIIASYKNIVLGKTYSLNKKAKVNLKLPYYIENFNITISKNNIAPYVASISVINNDSCSFPPIIDTSFIEENIYNKTKFISKIYSDGGSTLEQVGIVIGYSTDINLQNNLNNFIASGSKNNQYIIIANNLNPDTKYYAKAYAKNKKGVVYSDIMEFKTTCYVYDTFPKVTSFDTLKTPECWHIYDLQGNGQVWKIGRINETIPLEGNYIYLNSEAYGYNNNQNSYFETPSLDFSKYTAPKISFKHYLKHYSYSEEAFFVSTDDGLNWTLVKSWNASVLTPEICSFTFDTLSKKQNVRFKWNFKAKWAYYWCIDDIKIEGSVIGVEEIKNTNNELLIYPNPNNGNFKAFFTSFDKNLSVEILDLNSKIVFKKKIDNQNNNIYNIQLDLKSLQKGIYLIKISGVKTNLYNKLIINEK